MLSIDEINLLQAQNEGLKKQNAELQRENAELKADIEKKKEEQIKKMALNPLYGKIACIGYQEEFDVGLDGDR